MLISEAKLSSMKPGMAENYESNTSAGKRFDLEMLHPPVGYVYVGEYERLKTQNDSLRRQIADAEVSIHDRQSSYIRRESEYLQYIDSLERTSRRSSSGRRRRRGSQLKRRACGAK